MSVRDNDRLGDLQRGLKLARGAAVCGLALVAVLAGCGNDQRSAANGEGDRGGQWEGLPPGWSSLPPPPFRRSSAVSVWTGDELFHWGGDTADSGRHHADGAAYVPDSREWRAIPAGPLSGRSAAGAVWTGGEVLLWGGLSDRGRERDGAAFDPATRSWRKLAEAPLSPRTPLAAVWTGTEMLLWASNRQGATSDRDLLTAPSDGAAYDPAADRWRHIAPAPIPINDGSAVWTGEEMIVYGALLDGNNRSDSRYAQGAAYDPEKDSWRRIAPFRLSPQASSAVWTGDELLVWDYLLKAATYNPATDSWTPRPNVPLRFTECGPQSTRIGGVVLAWHCGAAAGFQSATGTWQRVAVPARRAGDAPTPELIGGEPVAAGSVVLFAGNGALWAYKP